ncbi:YncE family protein [Ancylobacter oerskovii]|uniref:YncE family protein n=1 Tax=Ancylobacter oerskovii TaxID=459519 RepID=A0ABW4YZL8_9HYPH|nr:YncE family protein [Ancylobacter oerskovii]MBS7543941.1 YncE family protein [Ancylobacter oerskovii]
MTRIFVAGTSVLAALAASQTPLAAKDYILATGRWDNTAIVIDVDKAIDPANDGTPNAVINRLRVTPDIDGKGTGKLDTVASGQPIIIAISPDQKRAYVVNHSGKSKPEDAAAFQHGHPGSVTVVDLVKALDPANNGTLGAVEAFIDSEGAGATGFAVTPDQKYGILAHAEGPGNEDGGRHINIVDLATNKVIHKVEQAYGKPGHDCPPAAIPHRAPDPAFGCFPDTNGVTVSPIGGGTVFTANGGTDDVSVISLPKALKGDADAEVARIPVQAGGFGITTSPDGKLVAIASRESARDGKEANTISIIDVEQALREPGKGEAARILVGTSNPEVQTRPFVAAFTPDGKRIVVTNFRTNNLSIIDVAKALSGQPAELARIALETPNGEPSRPRGVAFAKDGKYAAISGAPKGKPGSSVVWLVDLDSYKVAGRVTQIGNESYMLGGFSGK